MPYRKPSFLYFDLGNVIAPFDVQRACRQMAEVLDISAESIRQQIIDGPIQVAYETGKLTTDDFLEEICRLTNSSPDRRVLLEAYNNMFELAESVVRLIQQLRNVGYRVGLLSNTCEAHWRFCVEERFPVLGQLFDVQILSYEVQAMKPDRRIYEAAARAARTPAEEIFFTDDRQENIDGACRAGFDAVLYETWEGLIKSLAIRGVSP